MSQPLYTFTDVVRDGLTVTAEVTAGGADPLRLAVEATIHSTVADVQQAFIDAYEQTRRFNREQARRERRLQTLVKTLEGSTTEGRDTV